MEEKSKKEIVQVETDSIPMNSESTMLSFDDDIESVDKAIERAQKAIEFWNRVEKLALKRTNSRDWVDQGGFPYLTAPGCEKIAGPFGVKIWDVTKTREEREDDKGKYYFYVFEGKARCKFSGMQIEVVGTCSSRDKFFSRSHGKDIPQSDIDETNVLKAAYSNFMHNAVTKVLGMRNLEWEDISKAGVDVSRISKVTYKDTSGSTSKDGKAPSNEKATPDDIISSSQANRLWAISKKHDVSKDNVDSIIKKKGYERVPDIKRKDYQEIVDVIEKGEKF